MMKRAWWLAGIVTVCVSPHIPIDFETNTTGCGILLIDVAEVAGMSMGTRAELQVHMNHVMRLGQSEAPLHVAGRAG